MNRKYKIFALIIIAVLGIAFSINNAVAVKLTTPIPGADVEQITNPAQFIVVIYRFSLAIAGLLALAVIVFSGIEYIASAGNVARRQDAVSRITSAVVGLLLLLGTVLILTTINPQLTLLRLENIPPVKAPFTEVTEDLTPEELEKRILGVREGARDREQLAIEEAGKRLEAAKQSGDQLEILQAQTQLDLAKLQFLKRQQDIANSQGALLRAQGKEDSLAFEALLKQITAYDTLIRDAEDKYRESLTAEQQEDAARGGPIPKLEKQIKAFEELLALPDDEFARKSFTSRESQQKELERLRRQLEAEKRAAGE